MNNPYHVSKRLPPKDLEHEAIGNRMREIRVARGLSLRAVEALGGPCLRTLQEAEWGIISVTATTLKMLADVLGVSPVEFLLEKNADSDEIADIDAIAALVYQMPAKDMRKLLGQLKRKVVN